MDTAAAAFDDSVVISANRAIGTAVHWGAAESLGVGGTGHRGIQLPAFTPTPHPPTPFGALCRAASGVQATAAVKNRLAARDEAVVGGGALAFASGTGAKTNSLIDAFGSGKSTAQAYSLSAAKGDGAEAVSTAGATSEDDSESNALADSLASGSGSFAGADAVAVAKNNGTAESSMAAVAADEPA